MSATQRRAPAWTPEELELISAELPDRKTGWVKRIREQLPHRTYAAVLQRASILQGEADTARRKVGLANTTPTTTESRPVVTSPSGVLQAAKPRIPDFLRAEFRGWGIVE